MDHNRKKHATERLEGRPVPSSEYFIVTIDVSCSLFFKHIQKSCKLCTCLIPSQAYSEGVLILQVLEILAIVVP